ncbi:DUF7281 domain-containing protein [Marinospirillum alkaliphilum]|uniref:DUF7281 domain-containing protein n=1 Tax=Marinospirillum alkaliphilum DSM 21637 TaxID=1122209 RepID=A0A1K1YWC3_9GAMM|nr:hypothetical protein [Marinospirillum alkaliphilum]SFX66322.1 hypothetical protein SAMN02745752_02435 [Marinospirillum alkaliphilum DSM 21637]
MSRPLLTPALRSLLQRIQQQLKTHDRVTWRIKGPVVKQLLVWCDAWDIEVGLWPDGRECVFDRAFIQRVQQLLLDEKLPPLAFDASGKSSLQQAEAGLEEHKGVRAAPTAARVLVSLPNQQGLLPYGVSQLHARLELDLDWQQLDEKAFDALVVVENLDCFYQFNTPDALELPQALQPALILYRGHGHEARGCKALKSAWARLGKPCIYLGDFDAKGVSIALHEGYRQLLLPEWPGLQQQANALHQPPEQLDYLPALQRHLDGLPEDHPLQPVLSLLLSDHKGLKQQWFKNHPLQLYPLY